MTDAFEKLGKLVGASVGAAPGEGLPRTRAEAMALGLSRYYTGRPCKHGHVAERYLAGSCIECMRERGATPEVRERKRQYEARPDVKERERERLYRRSRSPEHKERSRQYGMASTGDAALFAINQAEMAAVRGRAPADIVPQCPEPHRSQLQALIDRIRQDPNAGKAVIALLRTMRELRKAELAQQRATESTTAAESNT